MSEIYGTGYLYLTNALPNRTTRTSPNSFSIKIDSKIKRIRLIQSFFPIYFAEKYISDPDQLHNIIINPKYDSTKKILVKINGIESKNAFDLMIYLREQYSGNDSPILKINGGTEQLTFFFYDELMHPIPAEELITFYMTFATYDQ